MSDFIIPVNMGVSESQQSFLMSVSEQINVDPGPHPDNLIANGDFSAQGATTDGWTTTYPARCEVNVTNSRLVLTVTNKSNVNYGIIYSVDIEANHTYLIRYKYKKTLGGSDSDGKKVRVLFGDISTGNNSGNQEVSRMYDLTQNDIVENLGCQKANTDYNTISLCFDNAITSTACENGDSLLELYYIEMYDITDVVDSW